MANRNRSLRMNLQLLRSGKFAQMRHPDYDKNWAEWQKFRFTMEGGEKFVEEYLVEFSDRESTTDFDNRKDNTFCSAHAKAAVNDVKNSIYTRMRDVVRKGGDISYQNAIAGLDAGVDRQGSSMDKFMGESVIGELLSMGRVGVFVDKRRTENRSRLQVETATPYLYVYTIEQILNWTTDPDTGEVIGVLLVDRGYEYDEDTGFPKSETELYRHVWKRDGIVNILVYNEKDEIVDRATLNLPRIPFVIGELTESLLTDIADIQIALTNLESSDINYVEKANFPFYTEQRRPNARDFMRPGSKDDSSTGDAGTAAQSKIARESEIEVGPVKGRAYAPEMDRPDFIHPSPEPLKAAIVKEEKLKETIKQLLHQSIANLRPTRQATDSKKIDQQGMESGLSIIGTELEGMEREIAKIWSLYQGTGDVASVSYPKNYSLKSDEERLLEAEKYVGMIGKIPSITYQRELAKKVVRVLLGGIVTHDELEMIDNELDKANVIDINPENLLADVQEGLLTRETASKARLYPDGEAEEARLQHIDRLKEIAKAQSDAKGPSSTVQGVPDLDPNNSDAPREGEE